ncbi:MAG: CoB--CoM heterodisulfide reductase iron-sulfur subunit A [Methanomassiliicoccales archaeon PtaU1.Bin124]|nr:MAG: CoB--CoM heterodisulfide reductase iron-sulfur subunit A [Methanomassiliicoccales archaeon PtaU1.Bin124]
MTVLTPPTHSSIEAPKGVAVFICGCRGKVSSKIRLETLLEEALKHPSVGSVEIMEECCCPEDMDRMRLSLSTDEVDRFLVAGCSWHSCRTKFEKLAESSGLDSSLVEVCNIKEHCALVHEPKQAEEKAMRLLKVSLARCDSLQPTPRLRPRTVNRTILIIGNGSTALTAAREAFALGHETMIVCPGDELFRTGEEGAIGLDDANVNKFLKDAEGKVTLSTSSVLRSLEGAPGEFRAVIDTPLGDTEINAGAVILAMDEEPAENPLASIFGDKAMTQEELERRLNSNSKMPGDVVMLAMDMKGESAFDPMSTHEAVHNALFLRTLNPRTRSTIITREVFALGQCEAGYRKSMEAGTRIVRSDGFPEVLEDRLVVKDPVLGEDVAIPYDLVVLDNVRTLPDLEELARAVKVPLTAEGRLKRPNAKLKPSESIRPGVFLCGTAGERGLGIGPTLEARSAAALASGMLRSDLTSGGEVAEVWQDLCSACLTCVRTCPYGAPSIGVEGKAEIKMDLCQGCGVCVGICPSKAIQMYSFRDDQITIQLSQALGGRR